MKKFIEVNIVEGFKSGQQGEFVTPRAIAIEDINYFQPKNKNYNAIKAEIILDVGHGVINSPKGHKLFSAIDRTIIRMENKYIIEVDATYGEVLKLIKEA